MPLPLPDDEDAACCARYEAEQARLAGAECSLGCDYPDGPLSAGGCSW